MKAQAKPSDRFVAWFEDLRRDSVSSVGGKCANLGELVSIGVRVPPGFAVTAEAYRAFLQETQLSQAIGRLLEPANGSSDPQRYEAASAEIRKSIESVPMPDRIADSIRSTYGEFCRRVGSKDARVAVRSSATTEDLPEASFAGQQDTYLNVRGADEVILFVQKCWSSLYTPRAIFYRQENRIPHESALIGVGVQLMVESRAAGVAFTIDPVTGDASKMVIESTWGLGESLVGGRIRPDRFVVEKANRKIVDRQIVSKSIEVVANGHSSLTKERGVPKERQDVASLTDAQVLELAGMAQKIESHYGAPQDIEFAVLDGTLYIVQARPETVWSKKGNGNGSQREAVVKGLAASPGAFAGKARVVLTPQDAGTMLREKDILVTKMTNPDWVPYMKMAGAIVTDDGGITCHAAIVSREMGIPCIVGTRNGTKVLHSGGEYTVDAKAGVVYQGLVEEVVAPARTTEHAAPTAVPVTSTKVYVNLSIPELADKLARETQADGVGLLRAEHMMLSVGKHPRLLIEEGGEQTMVEAFAEGIRRVAQPFAPRPLVYRFLDFKPDEFLGLPGGKEYEEEAGHVGPNPLIGYRGCFRYLKEPDIFRLECQAVKKVRQEFKLKNVHVMLPFVRTLEEFRNAKRLLEKEGLRRGPDFKLWIMVEVPSTVLCIDQFIEEGIDGISFGTNDLTMLILGIDRDDASIQEIYDERNPAVLRAMSHVIRICHEKGVTTSICGQAPSNHPEVVEFLVRQGATSLSVNPDKVIETKILVAGIERRLILEASRTMRAEPPRASVLRPAWEK